MNTISKVVLGISLMIASWSIYFAVKRKQYFPPDPQQIAQAEAEAHAVPAPSPVSSPTPKQYSLYGVTPVDSQPEAAAPQEPPVYRWLPLLPESFILSPGQTASYAVKSSNADREYEAHKIRFEVKSTGGVDAGALDGIYDGGKASFDYFLGSHVDLCYTPNTLHSVHECRLTGMITTGWILLRDPRPASPKAAIGAVAGAVLGIKEPLRQAVRENRVTLTVYEWKCVDSCPEESPQNPQN